MGRHAGATKQRDAKPSAELSSDLEIERRILSAVGRQVRFRYPSARLPILGVLKDRVTSKAAPVHGVAYWDVIDLIEFPDQPEPLWMRVGYYRCDNGRLRWGSQTSLTEPLSAWRALLRRGSDRPWIREVLDGVLELGADSLP